MKWTHVFILTIAAIALVVLGRCSNSWWSGDADGDHAAHMGTKDDGAKAGAEGSGETAPTQWTCPMHPEVKLPEFGPCPKCGMDLVPMTSGDGQAGPRQLVMSARARELARIVTTEVSRRFVTMPVRMVGKVDYDETRVRTIAARVGGRLDRLYVDYTGIPVKTGDHLVRLYSPELLQAQQELLEAKKRLKATEREASAFLAKSNREGYESAREKLLLWGLSEAQVEAVERRGTIEDHMLIESPTAGVIIHKAVNQGDYVKEGTAIYRIADLTQLWIRLDAFEQDLPWLRYGQSVSVQTEALPGEVFEGQISFIDPVVHEATRTIKVRVQIANPENKLKPGMFVRAVVQSRIGEGGSVLEPRLAGKWISPMHPEIVKDGPGTCDVCGMDLVPAESLGYVGDAAVDKPLVVPASAVLITGTRAVVYVEVRGAKEPTYEGREIILGPRAGDQYIVRAGLEENERVVTQGAFRIDSSMQIQAKPSMMSMQGDANTFTGASTAVLRASLEGIYAAYLAMQRALASDDAESAKKAGAALHEHLHALKPGALPRAAKVRWEDEALILERESTAVQDASTLSEIRQHFGKLSQSVLTLEKTFRHVGPSARFEAFCPMAFDDKGASWLQDEKPIRNPYFGKSMLACGEIRTEFPGVPQRTKSASGPVEKKEGNEAPTREAPKPAVEKPAPEKPAVKEPEATANAVDFRSVYDAYFELQAGLAADDWQRATEARAKLDAAGAAIDSARLEASARDAWSKLRAGIVALRATQSIESMRASFQTVSDTLLMLHEKTGHVGRDVYYRMHCPMAFGNTGADWLQRDKKLANPYFGARMLRCGSITRELPPSSGR